ncbi:DNA-directed RNA polymerases I, II, and III subunit RPABC5-like [Momordica charantia]|uniref:DNA-directed RNA polymerases I, II, and III subunit RPABC5 n=1 Tax=Momordica charantia TaxID=3673 RepID=A0A6J1DSH9_MOMCH|nr:DNA-directed RNA polymerases I, II, and III subunit RPABC5-like [Momordica charantia]
MLIPVRCFTCGKVIGNRWESYLDLLRDDNGLDESGVLDRLGLVRYCCRQMLITTVNFIERLLEYNPNFFMNDENDEQEEK